MNLPNQVSRPSKYTNAQTILYEIDVLRFTAGRFQKSENEWGEWSNLACFLLRFRNLIEFFGNPQPRRDDLNIQTPEKIWLDPATMPSPVQLASLHREDLWTKYEVRDPRDQTQVNDKISRYLQHCTEQRVEGKEWKVGEMFAGLEPSMSKFEVCYQRRVGRGDSCPHLNARSRPELCCAATGGSPPQLAFTL